MSRPVRRAPRSGPAPRRGSLPLFAPLTALAVTCGTAAAVAHRWVSDDAFISFRYADHLVRGMGLVFNPGEHVEGYSNFLWTVWIALGLRLGLDAEAWAVAWGVAAYAGSILLLAHLARRGASAAARRAIVPTGALLAALLPAWQRFASGGLETSLFTLLVLAGWAALTSGRRYAPPLAGALFALLSMTRPDGPLLAAVGGVYVLAAHRERLRATLGYLAAFVALWGPYTAWRLGFYHAFFPNTYYAKSAAIAWWPQGAAYLGLFLARYWPLLAGPALWGLSRARRRPSDGDDRRPAGGGALALAMALVYAVYVTRVGGDFMFARLLVPVVPLLLVLLDQGLQALVAPRPVALVAATAVLAALVALLPEPIHGTEEVHGVVNEWAYYTPEKTGPQRAKGEALRPYLDGLPARAVFLGGECRIVYYSRVPVALECATGLTDSAIAHQPLRGRGRPGHEKPAPSDYVFGTRRANLVFSPTDARWLQVLERAPECRVRCGAEGLLLVRWDTSLVAGLRSRGAAVDDVPASIDDFLAHADAVPDSVVATAWRRLADAYFAPSGDKVREAAFRARLARTAQR